MVRFWISLVVLLAAAAPSRAVTVSYTATLSTSKGNPVTNLLILESDGVHSVQATVYPSDIPGRGTTVISHEALYQPSTSLLIGLTEGVDVDGSDKTELVMFLDRAFAAANAGIPFSSIFPGTRHSETIASLLAAESGDAAALTWFTDTFFPGPAAGAAFASDGPFAVAEFTSLKIIGENATAVDWMLTGFESLPKTDPNAQSGKVTAVITETAKVDFGPFDIQLRIDGNGVFAVDKTVANTTGLAWTSFVLQLGSNLGAGFVPSTPGDGLGFDAGENNRETTGAFPTALVGEDRIVFSGHLAPGDSARFVVFVSTNTIGNHFVTIRQSAGAVSAPAPLLTPLALLVLVVTLGVGAILRLRRTPPS